MKQTGIIESVNGSVASVRIKRASACGGDCSSCGSCDNALLVNAENLINAQVGDTVELEMPDKTIFEAIFIAYIFPIIALIVGYAIGSIFFNKEWQNILLGIIAMIIAIYINIIYSKRKKQKYKLTIAKIIHL